MKENHRSKWVHINYRRLFGFVWVCLRGDNVRMWTKVSCKSLTNNEDMLS